MSFMNSAGPKLSLKSANIIPGKNAIADNIPTNNGASILIKVTLWKKNQEIALRMVITKPKKINKLKL